MIEFDKHPVKIKSRRLMVEVYFRHSNKSAIAPGRQFWSLCSTQSKLANSEINQLVDIGLITKSQYYGVDWEPRKIKGNRKKHPEAHWLSGDWETVIKKEHKSFNPEIVFLDFTSLAATTLVAKATQRTLRRSPVGTYLFANVMLNNPRDPKVMYTVNDFPQRLAESITRTDFKGWESIKYDSINWDGLPFSGAKKGAICLPYCTGYTSMVLYAFYKRGL